MTIPEPPEPDLATGCPVEPPPPPVLAPALPPSIVGFALPFSPLLSALPPPNPILEAGAGPIPPPPPPPSPPSPACLSAAVELYPPAPPPPAQ